MVSVLDVAVPGAGPLAEVLSTISQLSGEMNEGKQVCGHLHSGLMCIVDGLETDDQLLSKESLDKFVAVVKFLHHLELCRGKELVYRLVEYEKMADELQQVYEDIAELFELFDVVMVNWSEQWEHDVRVQRDVLIASVKDNDVVLRDLQDSRAQVDALLTLKFELEHRAEQHDEEIVERIKAIIAAITVASRIEVESAGSTPSRAEPQETLEISDDEDAMSDDIPIPVFLDAIQRGNNADCEQALFRLLQLCTDEDPRKMLCDLNGVPVLVKAVKTCYSYFGQLCALKCLSWIAHLDCRCSRQEYEELKKSVRAVAPHELISLTSAVTDGTTEDKLRAVMCCACVASARKSEHLDDFRIVELVIPLLRNANEAISAWAADALGNLSDRGVIADETIVSPLVEFLENGTNAQKTSAAFALGHLAGVNAFNCVTVMNCGGISSLGTLLETGTDTQKALAAFALGSLATSDDARVAIVGYLPDLVAFARAGTQIQREHAAFALGWLAHSDTICEMVITCGGITPLVDLVRSGTEDQKKQAALALGNVAVDSSENAATIFAIEGVFSALIELLQTGTDAQKENATRALSNLALNSQRGCAAITNEGAIPCLVELLHCGTRAQKGLAALTLGYLGVANKTNSTTIRNAGALELMVDLLRSEVDDHRQHAVTALEHLTAHGKDNIRMLENQEATSALVSLLRTGADSEKELGAIVLGRLAGTKPNREAIADEGGIPALVQLAQSGTDAQKEEAVHVLGRLAKEDAIKAVIKNSGAVDALQQLKRTGNTAQKRKAGIALKAISPEAGTKRRRSDNS
ncbi:hypothetical protein C6341_g11840 [Phytophthora cactorum]|nr:hypothetical protein C6341_g11840 [Phytophthora cactorum]